MLIAVFTASINQTNATLAGTAALVAFAFALITFDRWQLRGQSHDLAWTIAMILFAVGSLALWWAETTGWTLFIFRIFFVSGAVLNVAWLALGTIYLLTSKTTGDRVRKYLTSLSTFSIGVVLIAPAKREIVDGEFPSARELFGVAPRVLAAFGSGVPALIIIFGALWSTFRVLRKVTPTMSQKNVRIVYSPKRLALGNVLVATGTIVLSASGSFAGRLGKDRAFAITLLIGVCILFSGFLVASNSTRVNAKDNSSARNN
jgi:MFS family permease